MREWYTTAELAGLPGLPQTGQGVRDRANRENWKSQDHKGKGGGKEYHIDSLPQQTREYLTRQAVAQAAAEVAAKAIETTPDTDLIEIPEEPRPLATWQRTVRDARLTVLAMVDRLTLELGKPAAARRQVLAMAEAGTLPPAVAEAMTKANARARQGKPGEVDRSSLYRWASALAAGGPDALAPAAPPAKAQSDWVPDLLALYQHPGQPTVSQCVRSKWPKAYPGRPAPALRTAQRHIEQLPVELREWGRMGRRQLRSVQPFIRRDTSGLWPMDVVTVDGHSFKAYVRHPLSGRRIRPEITTYLDVATRRAVGVSLWVAESQYAIWLAMRHMVLDPRHGVPAIQYSDNGAYRGQEHHGILERIGTVPMYSEAYRAQARGMIERLNSSVWVPLAREQPTFCGDGVDQELFKRALKRADDTGAGLPEWDEAVGMVRQALSTYNATPHASLKQGRKHLTPDQAWERAHDEGWQPTTLDGDDLHDLLPAKTRKCIRGEITMPWGRYFSDDLRYHHTREVRVAYDPADGERVWVSDIDGRLLAVAKRDGNAKSYVPISALEHARDKREQGRVRRLEARISSARADETPVIEGHTLDLPDLVIPGPFGRIGAVIDAAPVPVFGEPNPEQLRRELDEQMSRPRDPLDDLTSDPERDVVWRELTEREAAGIALSERERAFMAAFETSGYFRSMREMEAEFDAATGVSPRDEEPK